MLKDIFVHPRYPESLTKLYELAYNLWCTWNYDAIKLFYRIDSTLFRAVNHNPVRFLYSLPKERIKELSGDRGFLFELEEVWKRYQDYLRYGPRIPNLAVRLLLQTIRSPILPWNLAYMNAFRYMAVVWVFFPATFSKPPQI